MMRETIGADPSAPLPVRRWKSIHAALLALFLALFAVSCASTSEPHVPDGSDTARRYEKKDTPPAPPPAQPKTPKQAPVSPGYAVHNESAPAPKPAGTPPAQQAPAPQPVPAVAPSPAPAPGTGQPAADAGNPQPTPSLDAPLSFDDCIRIAVERSPYLKGPTLEIQTRKLDEKDAWYRFFPNLNFTMMSDRKIAGSNDSNVKVGDSSLTLGLTSGGYNPIAAWIQHDAQKEVTKLAKMGSVLALQELIQQIGTAFINLDYLSTQIRLRNEIIDEAEKNLQFATRLENIETSDIEIEIAKHKKLLAQTEYNMAVNLKFQMVVGLRDIIGLPPYEKIQPNYWDFSDDFMRSYNATAYQYEYTEQNNIKIKMQEQRVLLADKDITAQWIKALPSLTLGVRQPDKINNTDTDKEKDFYFSTTMQLPLWQWGETSRAFERAEIRKQQAGYGAEAERLKFKSGWLTQKLQAEQQETLYQLALREVDLANLSLKRAATEFKSGTSYKQMIEAETNVLQAKLRANELRKNYLLLLLQIVSDSGDFMKRYVNVEDLDHAD